MNTQAQSKKILEYLQEGNTITPIDALEKFGCFRLGARCYDLRKEGHNIVTTMIQKGEKRFAQYKLVETFSGTSDTTLV